VTRLIRTWNQLEEIVLGWTLLGLALFAFAQVVLRYVFSSGFEWSEELGRYVTVFLTFLGASVGVKHGAHFSVDALLQILPPRWAHFLKAAAHLLCAVLFAIVTWYGWLHASKLCRFGVQSASLRIPMWVPYAPIPVLSAAIAVRFLLQAAQSVRSGLDGAPYGPGV
jgi:C4-dicarboxylate transporter DctQ subunit